MSTDRFRRGLAPRLQRLTAINTMAPEGMRETIRRTLQPLLDGDATPGPTAPPIEEQPVQMGLPIAAKPSAAP
jgi:hypothetical protein